MGREGAGRITRLMQYLWTALVILALVVGLVHLASAALPARRSQPFLSPVVVSPMNQAPSQPAGPAGGAGGN